MPDQENPDGLTPRQVLNQSLRYRNVINSRGQLADKLMDDLSRHGYAIVKQAHPVDNG